MRPKKISSLLISLAIILNLNGTYPTNKSNKKNLIAPIPNLNNTYQLPKKEDIPKETKMEKPKEAYQIQDNTIIIEDNIPNMDTLNKTIDELQKEYQDLTLVLNINNNEEIDLTQLNAKFFNTLIMRNGTIKSLLLPEFDSLGIFYLNSKDFISLPEDCFASLLTSLSYNNGRIDIMGSNNSFDSKFINFLANFDYFNSLNHLTYRIFSPNITDFQNTFIKNIPNIPCKNLHIILTGNNTLFTGEIILNEATSSLEWINPSKTGEDFKVTSNNPLNITLETYPSENTNFIFPEGSNIDLKINGDIPYSILENFQEYNLTINGLPLSEVTFLDKEENNQLILTRKP